jgi:hypothetical protein
MCLQTVAIIVGFRGAMALFREGYKRVVGVGGWSVFFRQKGRGGTPFFSQEKENIFIFDNFGHFVAQKVFKYQKKLRFIHFLPILVDFLLSKRIF